MSYWFFCKDVKTVRESVRWHCKTKVSGLSLKITFNSNLSISGLFWRIHQMDPYQSGILFVVVTLVSTYLVSFAYRNVKFLLKHKWVSAGTVLWLIKAMLWDVPYFLLFLASECMNMFGLTYHIPPNNIRHPALILGPRKYCVLNEIHKIRHFRLK